MKNKYIKGTHILEQKFRGILKFLGLDIEAEKTSVLVGFHALQINKFYKFFRERIVELFEAESPFENGEIELDESYGHMMVW